MNIQNTIRKILESKSAIVYIRENDSVDFGNELDKFIDTEITPSNLRNIECSIRDTMLSLTEGYLEPKFEVTVDSINNQKINITPLDVRTALAFLNDFTFPEVFNVTVKELKDKYDYTDEKVYVTSSSKYRVYWYANRFWCEAHSQPNNIEITYKFDT